MSTTDAQLTLQVVAETLSGINGTWSVEGSKVVGPGTAAVITRPHGSGPIAHADLGFLISRDRPDAPAFWDCAAGMGATPEAALRQAVNNWSQTTALAAIEVMSQNGEFADHYEAADPNGFPGWHTVHGPILGWGVEGFGAELQRWALDHPLLPALHEAITPALDRTVLNGIKIFFGSSGVEPVAEVKVNARIAPEATAALSTLDWPRFDKFGMVRTYVVLVHREGASSVETEQLPQGDVTADSVVTLLVSIVADRPDVDESALVDVLVSRGVERKAAMRAVVFVPLAFGRHLLGPMGVTFDMTYEVRGEKQHTDAPLPLSDVPEYIAATALASTFAESSPGFRTLALRSAEMNVVNQMLTTGSKPTDIQTTAALVMWDIL